MTELKKKFTTIAQSAITEFSINHPGQSLFAASVMEAVLDLDEEAICRAAEAHESLCRAVVEFIHYKFTDGKNLDFKKPLWLYTPEELEEIKKSKAI